MTGAVLLGVLLTLLAVNVALCFVTGRRLHANRQVLAQAQALAAQLTAHNVAGAALKDSIAADVAKCEAIREQIAANAATAESHALAAGAQAAQATSVFFLALGIRQERLRWLTAIRTGQEMVIEEEF